MLSARGIIGEQEEGPAFVPQPCQKLPGSKKQGTGRLAGAGKRGDGAAKPEAGVKLPPLETRAALSLHL